MDSLFDDVFNDLKKEVSLKRARFAKDDSDPGFSGSFETSAVSQSSFAEENEFRIKKERLEVECAICFKSFQNEQLLQNHQISSHNYFGDELAKQFSYECSQCDRVFISKQHLNQHIQNECGTDAKPTTIDKRMKGLRWGFESSHPIWKMFKRHVDEVDQLYGICNICGRKLKTSRGTTSGLWWHLRNCHPDDFISTLQAKKAKKLKEAQNSAFVDKVLKEKSAAWEKTEPLDLDNSTLLDVKPKMESVNMTPQARRQYSPLWKWFERHWEDDENRYAICHTCRKEINTTQGSTTALWKHLKKHHTAQFIESYRVKKISAKIKLEDSARIQIALKKENWVPELRRRNADVNVKPELRTGVVEVGSELLTFLMASNLPFSFVDSAPFRRFVAFLNPKYVLKTSPELANSTCDELFKKYQDKVHLTLKEDLLFVDGVSFTQKTVRNSVGNRFMVTTVHYADKNFNVKKFAIDCYKIENDGNKQQMNRIVGSIPELKESSMKTLVCHDQTEAGDTKFQLQTLVCLGKVVDDIVAAAVKRLRTFDDIFERCKKLMSTLGSAEGSKMIKKFGNMCKDADTATDAKLGHEAGIKTDLKSEVEQQVGSHGLDTLVNQLKRIINLRPILERIHREEPESLLAGFTSADFLLLNELLMLLDEFFTMLTKLSENQSFNIHLAVALIFNLQAILQKQKGLTQEMAQNFCRFLRVEVENRFPNLGTQITPFAVANFLNPYYKGCFLRRFPSWQSTKNYLAESLSNFTKATERRSEETEQGSSSNFQDPELNEADRWSLDFFGDQTNQSKSANEHSELQNEIKNYLDVSPRPSSSRLDPLQWWKQNEMEMPLLASLARKHLSIPPACSREGEVTLNFVENFEKLTILRENNLEYKI